MFFKFNSQLLTTNGSAQPQDFDWDAVKVTPDDVNPLPNGICKGLVCFGGGNISVVLECGGTAVLTLGGFVNNPTVQRLGMTQVLNTGTTATGIYALY